MSIFLQKGSSFKLWFNFVNRRYEGPCFKLMQRSVYKGEPPADDIKFTDEKVCKSFIMGLCPHALFNNTVSLLCTW